jgi:ATP adenylyltransferase
MNCPFCNLNEEINRIIYEGKTVIVIPSNPRLTEGHLLVIPKRHIEKPSDLTPDERKELFDTVLDFQDKLIIKYGNGCDIREHYRPFQKQNDLKVDHIHFHLIPRSLDDEIYRVYEKLQRDVFSPMSSLELQNSTDMFKDL